MSNLMNIVLILLTAQLTQTQTDLRLLQRISILQTTVQSVYLEGIFTCLPDLVMYSCG